MNAADLDVVARTIFGEARGEGWLGKIAVAHVIKNRVEADLGGDNKPDWWGEGYEGVCKKPYQFSCWLPNDPNSAFIVKADPATNDMLRDCYAAAALVMTGAVEDPTNGADHYFNPAAANPDWAKGRTPIAKIGRHQFYRLR